MNEMKTRRIVLERTINTIVYTINGIGVDCIFRSHYDVPTAINHGSGRCGKSATLLPMLGDEQHGFHESAEGQRGAGRGKHKNFQQPGTAQGFGGASERLRADKKAGEPVVPSPSGRATDEFGE